MNALRVLWLQTRLNFVWYFQRDGEMIFWSLAIPVFFLVIFSFALGRSTGATSTFLVPGIIGAQVLASGFWGVGAMLAQFRDKKLLRRIYLTPMPRWTFFASLICYRMVLLVIQTIVLVFVGRLLFHVQIVGNPLEVIAILVLGAATFVALGSVIGSLVKSSESANNISSVLTVPLAFVSDAYIPIDNFPAPVPATLRLLPSTQFVDAFRGIAMHGESLAHYGGWVALLIVWTVAATLVSARTFRWV